jgi:Flp pilus assembly protein TadG
VTRASSDDRGSAVVDFVLVGSLLTFLFLAVVQIAIDFHVRNVLAACVAEGARYGANGDVSSSRAGVDRAAHAATGGGDVAVLGSPVVVVTVSARLPLLAWFLPVGPRVSVTGHAVAESPR